MAEASEGAAVSKGSVIKFVDGTEVKVLSRFTTTVKYLREIMHSDHVKDAEGKLQETRTFEKEDGSRLYIAPDQAKSVVVEELK